MSSPTPFSPQNSPRTVAPQFISLEKQRPLTLGRSVPTSRRGLDWNSWQQRASARRPEPRGGQNVLIVGAGPIGRELAETLEREHINGRTVVGFLDPVEPVAGNVLGRVENLARIARSEFVDEIILAIPNQHDLALRVIREARHNRLNVRAVPDLYGYGWIHEHIHERGHLELEYFGNLPVLTLHEEQAPPPGLFWKRVLDVVLSAVALLVAAPLMAAVALVIKMASPGQALYRATRVGLKGRRFLCYKFRTMVRDADRLKSGLRARNERRGPHLQDGCRSTHHPRWPVSAALQPG